MSGRPPAEAQFTGCLIGQCVGDAVGFLVEGFPGRVCAPYADAVMLRARYDGHYRGAFRLGQYSDDSQLARELMRSMVARRGFDPADFAARVADLYTRQALVGGGRATARAAARLAEGVPWQEAGTPAPSAGNGSAMRAAPIGLMFYDDPAGLVRAAVDQGRCTHTDPRCSAGAVVVAGAVALELDGASRDAAQFLDRLAELAQAVDDSVATGVRELGPILELEPAAALPRIIDASRPEVRDMNDGISPYVSAGVLWSLYAHLRARGDYRRAVHMALSVGGDVDTTAAMTGAMAGARCGFGAVPRALVQRLTDRGAWRAGELEALAGRLWRLKTGG